DPAPERPRVLATKLFPPRLHATLVARPHLVSTLEGDPDRRVTFVCAPAGSGKSTLAAQWLAQLAIPSTWVTLEASDDSPRAFVALVVAAVQRIDSDLLVATDALLSRAGSLDDAALVHQLIAELGASTRAFALVLDDYHAITETTIHRAVSLLLGRLPPTMRVVVISRTEPPLLSTPTSDADGPIRLGPSDLAFTPTEVHRFYRDGHRLDLRPDEVALLHERTEGWAAGLRLVGVALRGQPRDRVRRAIEDHAGDTRFVDEYLWDEVIGGLPDRLRSFLLRTSILDRFTAGLCDAVTGDADGADLIRRCERESLFLVPLDDQGRWYRYHHRFADVLRERLTQTATDAEVAGLHRRAARWLEAHGPHEDAVRHAIAGHEWDRAVGLLEDECSALFDRDRVAPLRERLRGLPSEVFARSPRLAFWLAWALGLSGHWEEGARPLATAEAAWTAADDRAGLGLVALWQEFRGVYTFDGRQAIAFADRALALLPEEQATARVLALLDRGIGHLHLGEPEPAERAFADARATIVATGRAWFGDHEMACTAAALVLRGRLAEAAALCDAVVRAAGERPVEIWVQPALLRLGDINLEWGQLDEAERLYRATEHLADLTQAHTWRAHTCLGLARLSWARGASERAFDEIERGIECAWRVKNAQHVRNCRAWQARFWLAAGHRALARLWADGTDLVPDAPPSYDRRVEHLTHARLLIQEGHPDRAVRLLEALDNLATATGRDGDRVEIAVVAALAHKARGSTADARRSLERALELGHPGGYFRVFVDAGRDLAPLLRRAAAGGDYREYARRLLAGINGAAVAHPPDASHLPAALSEREVEVLRLVAAGLPNRDIGRQLFITEKTVKKHLSNIMDKLGAVNRAEAVDRARRLGVL
ncbi:MAG TPA: LuxR C-terminal-related transcriptional regulator, partial [Thermomicrobiales bacterium]